MSSLYDYQIMLYSQQDTPCTDSIPPVDLEDVANQIQAAWPNVSIDHKATLYRTGGDYLPLRYEDEASIFQMQLQRSNQNPVFRISLRFAYCNPESVFAPLCGMIEWLMDRYDMKAVTSRYINFVTDEPFEQTEVLDPSMIVPVFMPQMKTLWGWWQAAAGGRIAKLSPSEIDKLFD